MKNPHLHRTDGWSGYWAGAIYYFRLRPHNTANQECKKIYLLIQDINSNGKLLASYSIYWSTKISGEK